LELQVTRVLICGGRNIGRADIVGIVTSSETKASFERASEQRAKVISDLDRLNGEYAFSEVICGNGKGAELIGLEWAQARGISVTAFKAIKKIIWRESVYARNERMLTEGKPDLCVVFGGGEVTDELIGQVASRRIKVTRIDME
jgi:hypothetical protein